MPAVERHIGVLTRRESEDETVAEPRIVECHLNGGAGGLFHDAELRQHTQIGGKKLFAEEKIHIVRLCEDTRAILRFLDEPHCLIPGEFMTAVQQQFPAVVDIGIQKRVFKFQIPFAVILAPDPGFEPGKCPFRGDPGLFGTSVNLFAERPRVKVDRQKQQNDYNRQNKRGDHIDPDSVPFQP